MKSTWILFGALFLFAVLFRLLTRSRRSRGADLRRRWPLEAKRQVLSERERALFKRLIEALPGHIVLCQVQLIQLVNFEHGGRNYALFNRICRLSIDFVVLNPDTSIVAAIELDDATHERADRRDADARKTHALQSAGVHLVRWQAKALPSVRDIPGALSPPAAG